MLEPIFFKPSYKEVVWGGNNIKTFFHRNIEGNNIKLDIYKENTTINIPISFLITEGVLEKYPINPKCGKKIEGYYTLKVTVPGTYILEYHMSNSEETFCKV